MARQAGRKRELDGNDWYEVRTAIRYDNWRDGVLGGEVELLARARGAPRYDGRGMRIPKSEYRCSVEATGASFIEHDIYAAVRRVAHLAGAALKEEAVAIITKAGEEVAASCTFVEKGAK